MPIDQALLSPETLWAALPRTLESSVRSLHGARVSADGIPMGSDEKLQALVTGRNIEPLAGTRTGGVWGGVAVIPVHSMIRPMHGWLSGTSLRVLANDITAALDDPRVTSIVLDIDSPGGQVTGLDEISDLIYGARNKKPIVAHSGGGMIASAALWIASACGEIVLTESAEIGSVGVVATFIDWSAWDEKIGINEIEIVSSQTPHKRPDVKTDEGRARIQSRIDSIAGVFIDHLARNYGRDDKDKMLSDFGRGDLVVGRAAVQSGMASRISTLDDLLESLSSANPTSNRGFATMPQASQGAPTAPEKSALTAEELKAKHPEIAQALIEEGRTAGAESERARIKGIQELGIEGLEDYVMEASWDPEQTPEKVAVEGMKRLKAGTVSRSRTAGDFGEPLGADPDAGLTGERARGEAEKGAVIDINSVYAHINNHQRNQA